MCTNKGMPHAVVKHQWSYLQLKLLLTSDIVWLSWIGNMLEKRESFLVWTWTWVQFIFLKAPVNCLCRNWWGKWRVPTEQAGFVVSLSDLHWSRGVISLVVYQENRQLSRTKINGASLQLLGWGWKLDSARKDCY